MMAKQSRDIYQEITDKIIKALEKGVAPWSCPWDQTGGVSLPKNHSTGAFYSGVNTVLFFIAQHEHGYSSSSWLTYKQAKTLGGQVRKGEKGTVGVFYKTIEKESSEINQESGKPVVNYYPMAKPFSVFNLDQIDGLELPAVVEGNGFDPLPIAEEILISSGVDILEGGTRAYYQLKMDHIGMPDRGRFSNAYDFYVTALHELAHATKHKSRCDRKSYETKIVRGAYAFEELVAELSSMFTAAKIGLGGDLDGHASYIDSWLGVLREDKRAIFRAAAQAQKAHEWIMAQVEVAADFERKAA